MTERLLDHGWLPRLTVAMTLVCIALSSSPALGDTAANASGRAFRPWMLTAGGSFFRHTGITTDSDRGASDVALDVGIARTLSRRIVVEAGGTITARWHDFGAASFFAARAEARLYPTIGRSQADHFFFMLGAVLVTCDDGHGGWKTGVGPELGLGTDIFVGASATIYLQVSAAVVAFPEGDTPSTCGCLMDIHTDDHPFDTGFFRVAAGTRLGL